MHRSVPQATVTMVPMDDMIPLWLEGSTVPMLWARQDIEADAEAIMTLIPAG